MSLLGLSTVLGRIAAVQASAELLGKRSERAAAQAVASRAASLAPVKTGALRSSIVVDEVSGETHVLVRVPYAGFQEFGTVSVEARHFLQNAIDASKGSIISSIASVFKRLF